MKKLRFVSIIIVLLLFCPFIKQCAGVNKRVEGTKADYSNELKIYFKEKSENVFEIAYENGKSIIDVVMNDKKSIINETGFFTIFSFCIFSILLIITSLLTSIYSFLKNYNKIKLFTISSIVFILSITIVFYYSGLLERFGQIKIGFYLLLLSNFYMLYLLKQKKEQIL
ncbi:hypothetical protein [Flavobacterium sp.]|uniref:hypothetical protein n=1 Tax=Flavobacterium sp. TaxID=239 RepID=UPI001B4B637F|nr:hypothetical protein [Flavobacterium sp.]MBP6128687.1 hypothetical protein [Flavobacterium sp.]